MLKDLKILGIFRGIASSSGASERFDGCSSTLLEVSGKGLQLRLSHNFASTCYAEKPKKSGLRIREGVA